MTIRTIYTDVGGVLLTNGWDTQLRKEAEAKFGLDEAEVGRRHEQIFDDYECGRLSLNEYLKHVVFYEPRAFSLEAFKDFIFSHSAKLPQMIELLQKIKGRGGIKIAVLSNEGKEIAEYRFKKFGFDKFIDYYIVSSYVGMRKPDPRIFKLALDICQNSPEEIAYLEDRANNIEAAKAFGIQAILHKDYEVTRDILKKMIGNI